jgi:hypothetical protein
MNPKTVTIQGDLSRADVVELCRICGGKIVVEFGMGGSTLILARCAAFLYSYDTEDSWLSATKARIDSIEDKTARVHLYSSPSIPAEVPECDVLWVDGLFSQRAEWIRQHGKRGKVVVVHDCRRYHDVIHALEGALSFWAWVERIDSCPGGSNLMVITRREKPMRYEDWNETEKDDNRVEWNRARYVPDGAGEGEKGGDNAQSDAGQVVDRQHGHG